MENDKQTTFSVVASKAFIEKDPELAKEDWKPFHFPGTNKPWAGRMKVAYSDKAVAEKLYKQLSQSTEAKAMKDWSYD